MVACTDYGTDAERLYHNRYTRNYYANRMIFKFHFSDKIAQIYDAIVGSFRLNRDPTI
jgi:hypothetical protein